jgi:Na+-translocating ferredoxin:NAD+ oxidoreductase RnfD subunit
MSDAGPEKMTDPTPPAGPAKPARHTRPFLVWPVARREFYSSISIALLPPLVWGVMIFGFRAAEVLLATVLGAALTHRLLKHFTRRGQTLLFSHTLVSALVLAALSDPFWPPLLMVGAGAALSLLLLLFEGPGRDRVHPSVVVALLMALVVVPTVLRHSNSNAPEDAVLARNRLVMGDIRYAVAQPMVRWPRSDQIGGNDAVYMSKPSSVLARLIPQLHQSVLDEKAFDAKVDEAIVDHLPGIDLLMLGLRPGNIGTVSCLGLVLGGLYLAYRNVLRPRSVLLYLTATVVSLALVSFAPANLAHWTGRAGVASLWRGRADKTLVLQFYQFFSGDILFAAVIILALPGTEPITPRGRRWMLIIAGLITPLLQLADFPVPVATTVLLALQPLNPLFDAIFPRRSWLNARVTSK